MKYYKRISDDNGTYIAYVTIKKKQKEIKIEAQEIYSTDIKEEQDFLDNDSLIINIDNDRN